MKELNYKIYVLKIINNEEVRYVGLTKGTLKKRLNSHKSDAKRRKNTYKDKWFIKNYNKIEIILIEEKN